MIPNEYLDAAKQRMGISSDYALAKRLDCPSGHIAEVRSGKRHMPLDMAYRIAITLELDPAQVVADLEGQREKNAKRKDFWLGFTRRAAAVAILACTLALSYSAISGDAAKLLGGAALVAASAAYLLRMRYRA